MLLRVLKANYPRIEAAYYQVDLVDLPPRKLLNLTFSWLLEMHQGREDDWRRDFAPVFDPDMHGDFDYADDIDL